ncbi:MAG: ATP-binding protein [Proteobacteria bacterium]|nr:ATP-binding protein [Pseudomonadota bacterium]
MTWVFGLGAALGAAALVIAALVPPAGAALWPGLILLCSVTGFVLFRHVRHDAKFSQLAGGTVLPLPAADGATPFNTPSENSRESLLAALLDGTPSGAYAATGDGRLIYVNETLARAFGKEPSELVAECDGLTPYICGNGDGWQPGRALVNGAAEGDREIMLTLPGGGASPVAAKVHEWHPVGTIGTAQQPAEIATVLGIVNLAKVFEVVVPAELTQQFHHLFDGVPIGIGVLDRDGALVEYNEALERLVNVPPGSSSGRKIVEFIAAAERPGVEQALEAILADQPVDLPLEVHIEGKGGRVAALFASRIEKAAGDQSEIIVHAVDTTDQKNLELQFSQAQKMQAVGQLAGGIAHDFNNLLTAIIGFCDLLLMRHQAGDHSFSDIMQIKQNSNRAANLVRQLLAFSRQQTLKPEVLSITDMLADLTNLLRRLIGETIEMKMIHGRDVAYVKADQGQFEQIIINLAVNARDAMKGGGTLTIRTSNIAQVESVRMGHDLLPRGDYVLIEVSDTGVGIPKEHAGKIFEPFYTTKEGGAGTGLGLSTVYGIVKQFGGYVFVDSEPDQGANFNIFLPQHATDQGKKLTTERSNETPRIQDLTGQGTILLVEDEDAVRMFGARALRNKGYTVLEADSGETALELMEASEQPIDLLVTDVVMPRMDGPTLTKEVEARRPNIKVIYISGYAEDAFRSKVDSKVNFLPKPFSLSQLATKVKEVMLADEH